MTDFLSALKRCEEAVARLQKLPQSAGTYAEQRHLHLVKDFEAARRDLLAFPGKQELLTMKDNDVTILQIESLLRQLSSTGIQQAKALLEKIRILASDLEQPKHSQTKIKGIPAEIKDEMHADIAELQRCFDARCFRATVILCGRILETALHRKYYEATKNDLMEKSPGLGLGNLVAKLHEKGVLTDPALSQQIHLINQVRIYSVHAKKEPFAPSEEQAQAIMLYTIDIVKKLF